MVKKINEKIFEMLKEKDQLIDEMKTDIEALKNNVAELQQEIIKISNQSVDERLQHLEQMEKILSLRSCHEYDQYGINSSGIYNVDPDGPLLGQAPFPVFCNFDEKTTEVIHDHEGAFEIPHCTGDMCYKLEIDYSVPITQLETLITLSETCTQELTFDCFLAPLTNKYQDLVGAWTNRDGEEEMYFTGSNSGTHMCDCGLTNNCSDSEHGYVCNCDADNLPVLQQDTGTITNMTALPITGFHYGNLEYDSQIAIITVGRLKCRGKKDIKPEEIFNSCRSMKIDGESRSGNYVMNNGKVSFCDMNNGLEDDAIQQETHWMTSNNVL